jgi:hypothetical protein
MQYDRTIRTIEQKEHETNIEHLKKKIPVGARFFAHVQTGPGAHPAFTSLQYNGYRVFPEGKAAEAWC